MANSGNVIGQFREEVQETAGEVARDIKDAVGEMIEQGVRSVKTQPLTPQQMNNLQKAEQQKQLEDQKNLVEARRKIQWYKDLATAQKKVRDQEKQKQMQKREQQQEEQNKKMAKTQKKQVVITPPGKRQSGLPLREDIARTRQEIGKGHGVGG